MLSDSEAETDDLHTLTVNEHYAKAFQHKKEREELAKLKEKYGSDISDTSVEEDSEDSEDTSEDSDGVELTPAVDAAILRTLARIKKKDPHIYDGDRQVFEEEEERTKDCAPLIRAKATNKSKPLTIRQAALAAVLEDDGAPSRSPSPQPFTHVEEQSILQSETRAAFHSALDSSNKDDDDEDDFLVPRSRTQDEIEKEEEEYKAFLEREVGEELRELITGDVGDITDRHEGITSKESQTGQSDEKQKRKKEKTGSKGDKRSKQSKDKSKEDEDHEFLINYIFNRGWIDRTNRRIPTYAEIVDSSNPSKSTLGVESETKDEENERTFSDEESFDDLVDAFESSYNFRFEEPDGALIVSHPRNVSSVRRESTTRKEARQRKKERKDAEKKEVIAARKEEIRRERDEIEKRVAHELAEEPENGKENANEERKSKQEEKKVELARLKDLQAKELRRKLERISAEGGLKDDVKKALVDLDLDAPWDPEKHEKQMAALYSVDLDDDVDAEKPTWEDDIDIDDIMPPSGSISKEVLKKIKKRERKKAKRKGDDSDVDDGVDMDAMDADVDGGDLEEADREEWDGTEEMRKRKVDQYMEDVVNRLGFNDITADIPTRFHYIQTASEDYALSPAEILLATDAELNSYVGLKKMAPYRRIGGSGKGKDWDPKRNERLKEFREKLQARIRSGSQGNWYPGRGPGGSKTGEGAENGKKKRLGKKERAKLKAQEGDDRAAEHGETGQPRGEPMDQPSNKRKYEAQASTISEENKSPQKKRRRRHKKATSNAECPT
ncbi:KRI1-like family C-terminal-domain-containing protein [Pisolithus croceorrhizus]|nr:KRI1-like family C-terminal-domain-containing protein [Pisolithus croceorrhizus]